MPRKETDEALTVLDKETSLVGHLSFHSSVVIKGKFEGTIHATGSLTVEAGAWVKAGIHTRKLVLAGHVIGDCIAEERVELTETGRLEGNLKTRILKIAEGVDFQGKCEMLPPLPRPPEERKLTVQNT